MTIARSVSHPTNSRNEPTINFLKWIYLDVEPQFLRSYHERIKFIRNDKREGLIRSRNIGAKLAVGHFLVFLDSHCEVNVGWLEPLIQHAEEYQGAVVSPILDVIDWQSLQYRSGSNKLKGGFDWSLQYKWIAVPEEELESPSYRTNFAYRWAVNAVYVLK